MAVLDAFLTGMEEGVADLPTEVEALRASKERLQASRNRAKVAPNKLRQTPSSPAGRSAASADAMIACLSIEIRLMASGEVEVVIPDGDGGEYARVRAGSALRAMAQAVQYVDCVLFEMTGVSGALQGSREAEGRAAPQLPAE